MNETTATFLDRRGWPSGPWDNEPDRVEWRDGEFVCLALRSHLGAWCGYVGLRDGHPWHGKEYNDDACMVEDGRPQDELICHVPLDGEPAHLWWFGFDCAHGFDIVPRVVSEWENPMGFMRELSDSFDGMGDQNGQTYRDLAYVRGQIDSLAQQCRGAS